MYQYTINSVKCSYTILFWYVRGVINIMVNFVEYRMYCCVTLHMVYYAFPENNVVSTSWRRIDVDTTLFDVVLLLGIKMGPMSSGKK